MSEHAGEKTEQPTQRRLEEALKRGQIARSVEVQTAFVLLAVVCALTFTGRETWQTMMAAAAGVLSHLHDTPLSLNAMQGYAWHSSLVLLRCTAPVVLAAMSGGLLAGTIQNRFSTASEALGVHWERLNPAEGFKRVFSGRSAVPAAVAIFKCGLIFTLTFSTVKEVVNDPIFTSSVSLARFGEFLGASCLKIALRVLLGVSVIAAADYGYSSGATKRT